MIVFHSIISLPASPSLRLPFPHLPCFPPFLQLRAEFFFFCMPHARNKRPIKSLPLLCMLLRWEARIKALRATEEIQFRPRLMMPISKINESFNFLHFLARPAINLFRLSLVSSQEKPFGMDERSPIFFGALWGWVSGPNSHSILACFSTLKMLSL